MSIQKLVRIRTRIQWHGAIICSVDSPIERFQHTRVSLFFRPHEERNLVRSAIGKSTMKYAPMSMQY